MKDHKKEYYEHSVLWNQDFSRIPWEKERLQEVINTIPFDIQTILDVGCGNGFFLNSLMQGERQYKRLIGLDSSKEALKYVKTENILGSITCIPFKNKSFDLITCLEVLEHLPQEDFRKGILELQRVSKKYILLTVPNEEDLEQSLVICPECCCWFNSGLHMRSFNEKKLQDLFNKFRIMKFKKIYLIKQYYYPLLSWTIYRYWKKPKPSNIATCPQCGYQIKGEQNQNEEFYKWNSKFNLKKSLLKSLARLIWRPKEKWRWLLALYEKRDNG